jgi:hypothetical protein
MRSAKTDNSGRDYDDAVAVAYRALGGDVHYLSGYS